MIKVSQNGRESQQQRLKVQGYRMKYGNPICRERGKC